MTLFTRCIAIFLFGLVIPAFAQEKKKWTPPPAEKLESLISSDPGKAAEVISKSWGEKSLKSGMCKWIEKRTVLWAVISDTPVSVFKAAEKGEKIGDLVSLDDKGLQAFATTFEDPIAFNYVIKRADGTKLGAGSTVKIEYYDYAPESEHQEGVPQGKVTRYEWNDSKNFPNTLREYEVYIPAQYDGSEPAALMVFQDGLRHADPNSNGGLRAPVVFDNLIAAKKMPVTIGVFINPGRKADQKPGAKPGNRSFEYDSLGDQYVRFLLEEIIPYVVKEHDLKLSDDPKMWGISGGSSGCACAWTAAWERPDKFGKVLGWVGTFVDIRGANAYPSLVRKTERKPIRAALLDGTQDLDNRFGNWPLANQQMETALEFAGYDYKYWWGKGFHGSRHMAAMMPEMLTWLWSDEVK
ncbi:alpha/beta hydrolase-fold protein [Verrucomicrobiales bacterium]|nr:alpha/beta hydrolase-fold protein [Verrucomicrobiales bacterium]MDC0322167.1 alpha/beta hydrolase-fold protein [Verrucomicrobiales bacterium]